MKRVQRKLLTKTEFYVFIVLLVVCFVIQIKSGQFFEPNNLVDIANALIVPGIFAVGAFVVMVSGGVDVSFPALASLSVYATTRVLADTGYQGSLILPIVMVMVLGGLLGAINGFLISRFSFPTLIVTLGTASVFQGIMQGALNAVQINNIPACMKDFGTSSLFTATNSQSGLTSNMPTSFVILIVILTVTFIMLRYTVFGRAIYAVGGDENSAKRAGFNVQSTKFWIYVYVGITASLAGLIRVCMMGMLHPTNMLGLEMEVIACVVLGGTAITGGRGTLVGTMLGTLLITTVTSSLLLMGIDTMWQEFFRGLFIIIGTAISALRSARALQKK